MLLFDYSNLVVLALSKGRRSFFYIYFIMQTNADLSESLPLEIADQFRDRVNCRLKIRDRVRKVKSRFDILSFLFLFYFFLY